MTYGTESVSSRSSKTHKEVDDYGVTTEGCSVSRYYEVLKFTYKQMEPDKTNKYHMELDDYADDSTTKEGLYILDLLHGAFNHKRQA